MPTFDRIPDFIPSPYYHVPLADQVMQHSDWERVSHEMPFSDGLSGTLHLRITAKTPIFIRSAGEEKSPEFYSTGGRFAIPGSSVRGSIRNVLRILTGGRIGPLQKAAPQGKKQKKSDVDADDFLAAEHLTPGDWADAIFGTVPQEKKNGPALRGRVAFTHFLTSGNVTALEEVETVLGTPTGIFPPNYWHLNGAGERQAIRGWKRYAVRPDGYKPTPPPSPKPNMTVRFQPLAAGIQFDGEMTFHDLRRLELGALLWVLLWGGDEQNRLEPHPTRRHSIGMAKPYGYGSCSIEVLGCELAPWARDQTNETTTSEWLSAALTAFEADLPSGWLKSPPLAELLALVDSARQPPAPFALTYPQLTWFEIFESQQMKLRTYTEALNRAVPAATGLASSGFGETAPRSLSDLNVGDLVIGTVRAQGRRATHVFIDFGFKGKHQDGFLHIRQVSSSYVKNLESELPSGTPVRVKILSKDDLDGRIRVRCSMKGVIQNI